MNLIMFGLGVLFNSFVIGNDGKIKSILPTGIYELARRPL